MLVARRLSLRASNLLRGVRRLLRSLLPRGVVMQHQHDDHGYDRECGDQQQARGEASGHVLEPPHQERPGEAREIADRVDRRDAGRRGRAAQERRRERPEYRQVPRTPRRRRTTTPPSSGSDCPQPSRGRCQARRRPARRQRVPSAPYVCRSGGPTRSCRSVRPRTESRPRGRSPKSSSRTP